MGDHYGEVFKTGHLPTSLEEWNDLPFPYEYWKPWETLRPWFEENGYRLFLLKDPLSSQMFGEDTDTLPLAEDSFGLYGDRKNYVSHFEAFISSVYGARDRQNRDVVIKVVSKGNEGLHELEILRYLDMKPMRSDPNNATIRILELLTYDDWIFAVMPFCDVCDFPPFFKILECLDFAEQVLAGLAFLHQHRIAHLDVWNQNIVMNHHGHLPSIFRPLSLFRTRFPVRYWFIDFGVSRKFPIDAKLSECRVTPFPKGPAYRVPATRAPEADGVIPYDPFAADVYQTSRLFYAWFENVVPEIPGFLEILQDMSSVHPPDRISAVSAWDRMHVLRADILDQERLCVKLGYPQAIGVDFAHQPHIPRGFLRMFVEWSRMVFYQLWQRFWIRLGMS